MSWRRLVPAILIFLLALATVGGLWFYLFFVLDIYDSPLIRGPVGSSSPIDISTSTLVINTDFNNSASSSLLSLPLIDALKRVTKKPFGIHISSTNSPVQAEKFAGYHTGVDFEILPGEEDAAVPVVAICSGTLAMKKYASGYGGVAVEKCKIENLEVTIIYGHLKLDSIGIKIGEKIRAGDQIGVLGKGFSTETSGERKHLHLGIHIGTVINILGYVQNKSELSSWLDAVKFLK